MNSSNETIRESWRSVLSSLEALVHAMGRYGQSLEEFLRENNSNNTAGINENTGDDTDDNETSDEESHTAGVFVAREVVKNGAGQCVSLFCCGRN